MSCHACRDRGFVNVDICACSAGVALRGLLANPTPLGPGARSVIARGVAAVLLRQQTGIEAHGLIIRPGQA